MWMTRRDSTELERLENLAACLAAISDAMQRLTIRMYQTGRRARGHADILQVFIPCFEETTDITCSLSQARAILGVWLAENQQARTQADAQSKENCR